MANRCATQRIGIGAIGVGGRASLLLNQVPDNGRIVALCDCNLPRAEGFKAAKKADWPVYQYYEKLLERKDVDAVIIGTGEFQRVRPSIHACQAGKDVYAEKPLTLYIHEGRVLVEAVRRHGRVFQVGSQQRSMVLNRIACELIRSGGLGKIKEVLAVNYPGVGAPPANPFPAQPVPAGLDWDRWLSQAAWRPFNGAWMGWMGYRDFAGGEVTNWGAHGVDQIQWALGHGAQTGPVEMWPTTPGQNGRVEMRYANGVPVRFVLEKGPYGRRRVRLRKRKAGNQPQQVHVEPERDRRGTAQEGERGGGGEEVERSNGPLAGQMAHAKLARLRSHAAAAGGRRRDRPSVDQHVPSGEHHPLGRPAAEMGPGPGAVHRR